MMKYMSVGLIMTAGVAISAALANGDSQMIRAEAEAHALPTASVTRQVNQLSKINNNTIEKFNSIDEQSALGNQNSDRTTFAFDVAHADQEDTAAMADQKSEADQFTSLKDNPQRWLLLKYPQTIYVDRHVQRHARLETRPVANVGDASRELLPAVYQFTHPSENVSLAEETDADIRAAVRYKF